MVIIWFIRIYSSAIPAASRSLNVTEDRVTLVDIRYDGKKWLEGPNGRRLEMVDTLAIRFEVAEDRKDRLLDRYG